MYKLTPHQLLIIATAEFNIHYTKNCLKEGRADSCCAFSDNGEWYCNEYLKSLQIEDIFNGLTAEQLHNKRIEKMREMGYVYGLVENENIKTHPDIINYSDLSNDRRLMLELRRNRILEMGKIISDGTFAF
jgi:hypothetical protein